MQKLKKAQHMILTVYILFLIMVILEYIADYYLYTWAKSSRHILFAIGIGLYTIGVMIWAWSLKYESIVKLGILYSALTLIITFILGLIVFKEDFDIKQGIAFVLCIIAIIISEW